MNITKIFNYKNSSTPLFLLMGIAVIIMVVGMIMTVQPPEITQAKFADLTAAQAKYPGIVSTALDACGLCHTASFGLNPYGIAYLTSGKNFAAFENLDSDGDGFTNIAEITALTLPGDATSKPAAAQPTPTSPPAPTTVPTSVPPTPTTVPPPAGSVSVSVKGPATAVAVGSEFNVEIVVQGADTSTAIYGVQLKLKFDASSLQIVDGSLKPGTALSPQLVALSEINNTTGIARLVYSRQGNATGATGNVVIATLRVRATNASVGAAISLLGSDLILGTKEAASITVSGVTELTVIAEQPGGGTSVVSGQITLPARPNSGVSVALEGTSFSATTDGSGNFTINGATEGTYSISATAAGHLKAVCANKAVVAPTTQLATITLVPGDMNNDNIIDITDATTIGVDFGGTNNRSDLNGDGAINVLDLILLARNFGINGPTSWAC